VELKGVKGCVLEVSGLDALEGSPIVDIKPYSSKGDAYPHALSPEWSGKGQKT
jgi:tRNA (Thr-GGU) A37 N-methylase